eukprot:12387745-Karenia_brevis.AAC.1
MVHRGEMIKIARGLLERNLLAPVPAEEVPRLQGEMVTNGWFGVKKDKKVDKPGSKWHACDVL